MTFVPLGRNTFSASSLLLLLDGPLPANGFGLLPKSNTCSIGVFYLNGTISRVAYTQKTPLEDSSFSAFLFGNVPDCDAVQAAADS